MKIHAIDSEKIETAINDFENHIDFEFVPVIAKKSSYVEHISWVLSLLFLILFIGIIDYIFVTHLPDTWMSKTPFYIAAPFVAFLLGVILDKSDYVDRFFITKAERNRQVLEKAELIFYKNRWHEVKSQNAVMLYISVMERQIVLFHDPKIQFKDIKTLNNELLKILQYSFKRGDFEEGLLKCIEHLKLSLKPHFAKAHPSSNNVANRLIWWND
jgi:uncharacterized membrane protein